MKRTKRGTKEKDAANINAFKMGGGGNLKGRVNNIWGEGPGCNTVKCGGGGEEHNPV